MVTHHLVIQPHFVSNLLKLHHGSQFSQNSRFTFCKRKTDNTFRIRSILTAVAQLFVTFSFTSSSLSVFQNFSYSISDLLAIENSQLLQDQLRKTSLFSSPKENCSVSRLASNFFHLKFTSESHFVFRTGLLSTLSAC